MKPHVAVIKGGWSAEREVSLVSGGAAAKALAARGYKVTEIDAGHDLAQKLAALRPDVAFNALHGRWGEDGCVQGILEVLEIPYTHSGVMASAVAMNKPMAKRVCAAAGVPVTEDKVVASKELFKADPMPRPYVVKPIDEGSSVGVVILQPGDNTFSPEVDGPWHQNAEVMVERYIAGRELTCAVIGDRPTKGVTELRPKRGFYDYEAKYSDGMTEHLIPAPVSPEVYERVRQLALAAHQALGCRGVSRADFRYDDTEGGTGELILLEVNTQPGMTPLSLVPEMAAYEGISFEDLVVWMVEDASCRR
jgi:D-alanine-D-alanine ligase